MYPFVLAFIDVLVD